MSDDNNGENNKPQQDVEPQIDSAAPTESAATTTTEQSPAVISSTPKPAPSQATTTTTEEQTAEPELEPFEAMQKREYDHAIENEIRKGIQEISNRFSRLVSQEKTPTDVAKDALGNTSDYYERIMNSYQSGNYTWLADTKEGVYELLYDLDFTQMRKLEAIKQEYNQK